MKIKGSVLVHKQDGVALITVLFLFALATVIVSGLVTLLNTDSQRASAILESEQASLLCLSGEEWARQFLAEDYKINPDVDHIHEAWAEDGKILLVDNGYIEISIRDAQGKFNINNLVAGGVTDPKAKQAFQNLIDAVVQDQRISTSIAEQAADWLDTDVTNGIEEADYLSEPISYRPPNSMITDVSELRWLKDMDQKTYKSLHQGVFPFLTVIPNKQTKININTVSPEVLAALAPPMSLAEADSAVKSIQANPNGVAVAAIPANIQASIGTQLITYSEYFEVRIRAKFADHYAFMTSIIFRDHANKGEMEIISRDRSERFIFPFSKDYDKNANSKNYEIDI